MSANFNFIAACFFDGAVFGACLDAAAWHF
jgi:hypothetical protein